MTLVNHQRLVRIGLDVWLGLLAAVQSWLFWSQPTVWPSDLEPVWAGARAWLAGRNPYDVVGPGREIDRELRLFYPFPAVLFGLPLAGLPLHVADAIFAAIGTAVFAYAVTAQRLAAPALAAFVSASLWAAVQSPQWSLLLVGAALTPVLGFLLAAKPTIGLALFVAFPANSNDRWNPGSGNRQCHHLAGVDRGMAPGDFGRRPHRCPCDQMGRTADLARAASLASSRGAAPGCDGVHSAHADAV